MLVRKFSGLEVVGLLAICFVAVATFVHAVSVPNTFVAGDPARASEVNANFAALENAVTNLEQAMAAASGVPVVFDANDKLVGVLTNISTINHGYGSIMHVDDNGYVWNFQTDGSLRIPTTSDVYYSGSSCTGIAYVQFDALLDAPSGIANMPFQIHNEGTWRVVSADAVVQTVTVRSYGTPGPLGGGCGLNTYTQIKAVTLNSTSPGTPITPPGPFALPLRIGE